MFEKFVWSVHCCLIYGLAEECKIKTSLIKNELTNTSLEVQVSHE